MKAFKIYSVFILLIWAAMFSPYVSCSKKDRGGIEQPSYESKFISFLLDPAFNEDLEETIIGDINENVITLPVPSGLSLNGLIATFTYKGTLVTVGGVEQVSDITQNDFSKEVIYTIVAEDGKKSTYRVVITQALPRIPRVYINTEGKKPITSKDDYVKTSIIVDDIDSLYTDGTKFISTARIKGRGNSTWTMPKKPYRINLDSKASLLGMSADKDWALLANYTDKTLLRNITAFEIARIVDFGWVPTSVSVDLYLNDEYQGVYTLTEHVKVSEERVKMQLVTPSDNSGEALTGDYFLELDFHYDEPYKFKTDIKELPILFKDPDEPTLQQYDYVKNFFNNAEHNLYSENFRDPQNGYRKFIDVPSFINYYIVQELSKNVDGNMRGSCYMGIRKNGKIEMPLVWDFDIAFGNANHITWEQGASSVGWDGWFIKTCSPWFDRFFEDPAFVSELKQRWRAVKPQLDKIPDFIKAQASKLNEAQRKNFSPTIYGGAGWDITEVMWPNFINRGSYTAEVQYLVDFVEKRISWLDTNIEAL